MSADAILSNQTFDFIEQDLIEIKLMWTYCQSHPEKCPEFDNSEVRELIQDNVDGYLSYLNTDNKTGQ